MDYSSLTPLHDVAQCDDNGVDWLDASKWVRTESDRQAIRNGCWFDADRAAWACYWMETELSLYEDPFSGQPIRFLSTVGDPTFEWNGDVELYWDVPPDWEDARLFYHDRMRRHNQLYAAGEFMHWHGEAVFQVYGWVRHSTDRRRQFRDRKTGKGKIVRRFTRADCWIAKKNGKSPFVAANCLYLLAGDGENGAKVGFAASDLGQAKKIIGKHAFKMVERSANLVHECKTNMNECSITYLPMDSEMFPVSAGNIRSADAQHGLNLSAGAIDEAHVCGRSVFERMNRAFRSRMEPLEWICSTAGENPESWGKTMFDTALEIVTGTKCLEHVYAAVHAAPQGASDEDIDANIVAYIQAANPALEHIVGLDQTLKDYDECKHNGAMLATFKYEILNIWVTSSVTWLPPHVWPGCGGWTMEPEDVAAPCVIGFDNAATKDLASAVFAWEYWFEGKDVRSLNALRARAAMSGIEGQTLEDERNTTRRGVLLHPIFWTNEARIEELSRLVPKIREWADLGYIRVCPGDTNSNQIIARDLHEEIQRFHVVGFVHDPWHCDPIVQFLTMGVQDRDGQQVYEPVLNIEQCVKMVQTHHTQAGPTADFEADLRQELIGHQDHPVLSWQFSHAVVRHDKNGNIKVEKEGRKSFRTVDGVQAAIMSRWGLLDYGKFLSRTLNFYERNALETL